ncbi:UNKNOWN [Stylonychia lemnae]|uniref:Trichohyalin-plectin-homology domain-containing protein n=1 Tax=Stylonychia lemnae TaxID=5949 RepID=A0A078AS42_STYLE|nr:UNKNOWN [Stylonychia lemnae]|eukprot:CDW85300.1 UNKNOWN [Stylonychia lemnae]
MSESRKERLVDIQKREQLKGLLSNKFKVKYGNKPSVAKYIDNEVAKFLKNDRLTEENLKKLDDKILKETLIRDKKENIQASRQSQKQDPERLSHNSGALSRKSGLSGNKDAVQLPHLRYQESQRALELLDLRLILNLEDEDDEWTAIMKFNTLLHYEEQKKALLREQERKRLIRQELDKQMGEKNIRKHKEKEEDKIRDKQMNEEHRRKKLEQKEQFRQEVELVNRLHQEMDQERQMIYEKRKQERDYLQKMLIENEKNQKKLKQLREQEKLEDISAQKEYSRMLEKQEQDRLMEIQAREKRAQDFMNRMADTVIKQMDQKANEEEMKIRKYEMEKELRERLEDQRRFEMAKTQQIQTRKFLSKQMEDKLNRERMEKALNDEQAVMWKQDKDNYEEEERRLNQKIKTINNENAKFLQDQMESKKAKEKKKMNKQEFLLNKPLLREINQKKKAASSISDQASLRDIPQ